MKKCIVISLFALSAFAASAQSIPIDIKAGKVSMDELTMVTYLPDTSATALILYEIQDIAIIPDDYLDITMVTEYSARFKVLKEDGKDVADFVIPYYTKEYVKDIRVTTYNLENGAVKKTKLDKKYIFNESLGDDMFTCSFSAPEVRVGSVVEVLYTVSSPYYSDIPILYFQKSYPVNLSKVVFTYPQIFTFGRSVGGYLSPEYKRMEEAKVLRNNVIPTCMMYTDDFTLKDVPAMRREKHSMCPSQYRSHVAYELSGVNVPGLVYRDFSAKWGNVYQAIRNSRILSQCFVTGKQIDAFRSGAEDEMTALAEVRNAVLETVKWNGNRGLVPDKVSETLKNGSGSAASINAVVASVLNSMGYRVSPVVLRRRSRGYLTNYYVRTDAFTDMILLVTTPSGQQVYWDAAPEYGFPEVLDPQFFVDQVMIIPKYAEMPAIWTSLTTKAKGSSTVNVKASLSPDGTVTGTLALKAIGTESYLVKQSVKELGSKEKYIELVEESEGIEVESFELDNDNYSAETNLSVEFSQVAEGGGDMVYIDPFLVTNHYPGDFPAGERHTPVDFTSLENVRYSYVFTIPEGYDVVEVPPTKSFRSPVFEGRAACQSSVMGNVVMVSFSFKNSSLMVPAESYDELRAFWEQLCNIYNGRIVLKKK